MNIEQIARVCHAANLAYCESIGDHSQKSWEEAEQWQRDSALKGVEFAIAHPNVGPLAQHEAWSQHKLREGWKLGPIKDPVAKTHPCLVAFADLPAEQKAKDFLFRHIVKAFVEAEAA
jgi:hypothetical protein